MSNGDLNSEALERTSTVGKPGCSFFRTETKESVMMLEAPMSATLSLPAEMKMGLRWSTRRCLGGADANASADRVLFARAML